MINVNVHVVKMKMETLNTTMLFSKLKTKLASKNGLKYS